MPRKGHIAKREVPADPVYDSPLVTKFVNSMMWGGKKSTAQNIFYTSMKNLEAKGGGDDALKLFKKAVENCKPLLEVKSRRVGGANYQVPIEVNPERRTSLGHPLACDLRSCAGRKRHDRHAYERIAGCREWPWRSNEA